MYDAHNSASLVTETPPAQFTAFPSPWLVLSWSPEIDDKEMENGQGWGEIKKGRGDMIW